MAYRVGKLSRYEKIIGPCAKLDDSTLPKTVVCAILKYFATFGPEDS